MKDSPCFPFVEAAYGAKGYKTRYNADIVDVIERERGALVESGQWIEIVGGIEAHGKGEPFTIANARTIAQRFKLCDHWAWEILDYAEQCGIARK